MSIESELTSLLDDFSSASTGLFTENSRYGRRFETGTYKCVIAKPSKRMRSTLAADREVLVVASNFADQQQRTVKFVKHEIEKSKGRLEQTVAVVVHKDPEGNRKLRNWGRDLGISILPVFGSPAPADPEGLVVYSGPNLEKQAEFLETDQI